MDGTIHSGLGPSSLINNQENVPTDMPTGQSDGGNSSVEASSPKDVKLITKMNHHSGAQATQTSSDREVLLMLYL